MQDYLVLTPAQQRAADGLLRAIPMANVMVLRSDPGMGRTTVLRKVRAAAGGALIEIGDFMRALMARHPAAIEEAFLECIAQQLTNHDLVIVDDLHILTGVAFGYDYPRPRLLHAVLTAIASH